MKTKLFCNFCGGKLENRFTEGKERQVCSRCGEIYYENPLPVVSVILANDNRELLLVKRAREPSKDTWCFPIGFAESGESIGDAAMRELKEEAGIEGRVVQIIDVFSEFTEPYGEVLVVSFEAEKIGGLEIAGDDACDVGYFPATRLPELAFGSQQQAVKKFLEFKRDAWDMSDSFRRLVAETTHDGIVANEKLLSDELINVIGASRSRIIDVWLNDISTNASTTGLRECDGSELTAKAVYMIGHLEAWLKGGKSESDLKHFYFGPARQPGQERISLGDVISSLSLLKKHIFRFTSSAGVWYKPVDLYRVLELGERLVYFFDRAVYYTIMEYGRQNE